MIRVYLFVVLTLLLTSCGLSTPKPHKPNEKTFALEDTYIIFGLRAEEIRDYKSASDLFETLYEKSEKKEYLYRSLENDLMAKEYDKVVKRVDCVSKDAPFDAELTRLKVVALFENNKLDAAIDLSVLLASKTKKPEDYLLTADIYRKRKEFDLAVRYLEGAYAKGHNEQILDKMSMILYVNLKKKKEAIADLETHSRIFGCSERVCHRLAAFYSNENNLEGLLSTYLRMYEYKKSDALAKKIVQIYTYKRDYLALMGFLEKSGIDDEALLQLYASLKNYNKAYHLADKLYEQSGDVEYLAQSAMYEYEADAKKPSKEVISSVIKKLKNVAAIKKDATYLNYLGYIMIEHSIDVKQGMAYVDEALKIQPDSAYYLDSKAWGYYRLGKCKKALRIIKRVRTLKGGADPEVTAHYKAIKKCIQHKKGKKRK